jgi:fructoselysine-6-P-deglycase FrlB-like protein
VAEQEEGLSRIPMLDNIMAQPASHRGVLTLHQGNAILRACAEKIRKAQGQIIFSAMGGSLFATLPAVSRLAQQGHPVQVMESAELLHYGSATLRAGDVGVVVSRSGGSIEPVLLAEKMRKAGMTVVGVTNVPGSELEGIADIILPIGSQSDKLIAVQTYTGTVLALLLLAEEVLAAALRCRRSRRTSTNAYGKAKVGETGSWADRFTCWGGDRPLLLSTKVRCCCTKRLRRRRWACPPGSSGTGRLKFSRAISAP